MFGLLNLYKPLGWTSHNAIQSVRRCVHPAKVGHAGTLDPLATGVLVVCVGPATRLIEYVQRWDKSYSATFLLGRSSPSDDLETPVVALPNAPVPSRKAIEQAVLTLVGDVAQTPPAYSAVKIQGQRSYLLARRGRDVPIAARKVRICAVQVVRYAYPALEVDVRCGSGTYLRALGRDLAKLLGTVAVMSSLVRTAVGEFHIHDATPAARLTPERVIDQLKSPLTAVENLPQLELTHDQAADLSLGRPVRRKIEAVDDATPIAAIGPAGELTALLEQKHPGLWFPTRNFSQMK